MKFKGVVIGLCLFFSFHCFAVEKTVIRIGVQAAGTLEWELTALQADPLFKSSDFQLKIEHLANAEAGKIALQSGSVDVIVSDWVWVSSLRADGADFTFYPYSNTSGALVVPENSSIHSVEDLKGKRLGVAGGELDKNWLLLQALAQKNNLNLESSVEKTFGAPPLINEQIKQNRVDAVLTYWHFAARLESQDYRQIIDGKGILKGLGITENVPSIGYVFKQSWAENHKQVVKSFLAASKKAKNQLCISDDAWQKIIPVTHVDDVTTQKILRQRYCEGGVDQWSEKEQQAAARIYEMLRSVSNKKLTGQSEHLQPGTFWSVE